MAIVRTEPAWRGRELVQEWQALTFRSIAAARRCLYLENQYFTAPDIAEAIDFCEYYALEMRRLAVPQRREPCFGHGPG